MSLNYMGSMYGDMYTLYMYINFFLIFKNDAGYSKFPWDSF
jgi:hypothetical protein